MVSNSHAGCPNDPYCFIARENNDEQRFHLSKQSGSGNLKIATGTQISHNSRTDELIGTIMNNNIHI